MSRWHDHLRAARAVRGTARGRGTCFLAAALLLAAACGEGRPAEDGQADPTPPPAAEVSPEAAPEAAPAAAAPLSTEDSIRLAREDSTELARDYHQRLGARESYAGCVAKAKDADPQQRAMLEAACKRSRGTAP